VKVIREGLGRLVMEHRRADDGVAVLYSPASMLLASLEDEENGFWDSAASVPIVWQETLFQYRMLAEEEVEKGALRSGKYRVLYLPYAQAISGPAADEILTFARGGGVVMADLRPGVADGKGKQLAKGSLDDLFGVKQETGEWKPARAKVLLTNADLAGVFGLFPEITTDGTVTLTDGQALGEAGGVPVVIVHPFGSGSGILLNMKLVDYVRSARDSIARFRGEEEAEKTRDLFLALLRRVGVEPPVELVPYVPGCHVHRFEAGEARLFGVLWDAPSFLPGAPVLEPFDPQRGEENARALAEVAAQRRNVTLTLRAPAHVYDALRGKYEGFLQDVEMEVRPGVPNLFAALPYRVKAIRIAVEERRLAPGDTLRFAVACETESGRATAKHVYRVEFEDPAMKAADRYTFHVAAEGGAAQCEVPLAFNDRTGKWKIKVRDLATGVKGDAAFEVR
ncbi:MAG: MG2 domain-containing protein, partial [Planctomycetota bacterium]